MARSIFSSPRSSTTIAKLGKPVVDLSTEIIPNYLGRILCVETDGYHRDIGNPESLRAPILSLSTGRARQSTGRIAS